MSVSIGPPPPEATGVDASALWLYAVRSSDTSQFDIVRDRWEAVTIAGAYAEQCASSPATCIVGVTIETPVGPADGDSASVLTLSSVAPPPGDPSQLAAMITKNAQDAGLTDVSVDMQADGGPIAEVTAVAADPKSFMQAFHQSSVFEGLGLVGALIEVRDSQNNPVIAEGLSYSTNEGAYWIAPAYATSAVLTN